VLWLSGRIAAGRGRRDEARAEFAEAHREFAAERATPEMARRLIDKLERARRDPRVRFEADEMVERGNPGPRR
jgi:hypothetical protein